MNYQVGYRDIDVVSDETGESFPMAVVYPTLDTSDPVQFGPFEMDLTIGGKIAEGRFPLVIISHGSGGSNLGYRSIAFALVNKGFVVGMPLHPKNNYMNNESEGRAENWKNRPKHIKASIDTLLSNSQMSESLDTDRIAVIGHSAGGYAALAIAGGVADTGHMINLCARKPDLNDPFLGAVKNNALKAVRIETPRDERIKALVLMAPVGILFSSADALAQVDIPTLLQRAEKDDELTEPYQSELIVKNFKNKSKLTYQVVKNAGHYSFITPFPAAIKDHFGIIAKDPKGFCRAEYHETLSRDIVDYLVQVLN